MPDTLEYWHLYLFSLLIICHLCRIMAQVAFIFVLD